MVPAAKASIAVSLCVLAACAPGAAVTTRSWPTMGTYATVVVRTEDPRAADRAVERTRAVLDRVATTMSNWSEESELTRMNRAAGRAAYAIEDAGLAACVQAALDGAERTGGAFDPTVGALMTTWGFRPRAPRLPSDAEIASALERVGATRVHFDARGRTIRFDRDGLEIDLGGIAKGCALDTARREVAATGGRLELDLDLGGQWAFLGGERRATGIADPEARDRTIGTVTVGPEDSIATSSASENHFEVAGVRYGHVMDPRTGRPAQTDVIQATAIDPSATTAEVLGKALMVAGSAGAPAILRRFPTARAVLVVREGERLAVLTSEDLRDELKLAADGRFSPDSPRMIAP